jgi:UDP-N-acetylmuramoyl-L-alanyl-D-glutamate--2,6-diaminopimelate ligase
MKVYGVVGTNGKTTTTYIIESILNKAGMNAGVIGTINYRFAGSVIPAKNTTPESLDLQRMMRQMSEKDVKSAVIEVSSHALHQGRTDGIYFDAGIFTNLTQDHLDYHLNMRNYFLSKRRFFSRCLKSSAKKKNVFAAINIDDEYGKKLFKEFKDIHKTIPYSMKKCAGVYLIKAKTDVAGLRLVIHTPSGELKLKTSLTGEFNIYNILGAVALCAGEGISLNTIKRGVEDIKNIPGRMQKINTESGCVFVDYAHTPDALLRVIRSVRGLGVKRVITVFGCGGDRDRTKRKQMGGISAKLSDISIVTSDNPRSEEPVGIINEILEAFLQSKVKKLTKDASASKSYLYFVDRKKAIKKAIQLMQKGDAVIIAGKGHEDYQIIKDKTLPFDDLKVVEKYLRLEGRKIIR